MYKIPTLKYFWAAVWTFPVGANKSAAVKLFTAGGDFSSHCWAGETGAGVPCPTSCFGVGLNLLGKAAFRLLFLVQKAKQSCKV